uniref:Putative secreted protein n=1 Tax=Ixodes scapularis TaxID=6945 RepID=A0A4D5S146_IXOSC
MFQLVWLTMKMLADLFSSGLNLKASIARGCLASPQRLLRPNDVAMLKIGSYGTPCPSVLCCSPSQDVSSGDPFTQYLRYTCIQTVPATRGVASQATFEAVMSR